MGDPQSMVEAVDLASILDIAGPLRLRPHGSTFKAHIILRRVVDQECEGKPHVVRFRFFAHKRLDVKAGKEVLLAIETEDEELSEVPMVLEADLKNEGSPTPQVIPPKMRSRRDWTRREVRQPPEPATVVAQRTSVGVQVDLKRCSAGVQTMSLERSPAEVQTTTSEQHSAATAQIVHTECISAEPQGVEAHASDSEEDMEFSDSDDDGDARSTSCDMELESAASSRSTSPISSPMLSQATSQISAQTAATSLASSDTPSPKGIQSLAEISPLEVQGRPTSSAPHTQPSPQETAPPIQVTRRRLDSPNKSIRDMFVAAKLPTSSFTSSDRPSYKDIVSLEDLQGRPTSSTSHTQVHKFGPPNQSIRDIFVAAKLPTGPRDTLASIPPGLSLQVKDEKPDPQLNSSNSLTGPPMLVAATPLPHPPSSGNPVSHGPVPATMPSPTLPSSLNPSAPPNPHPPRPPPPPYARGPHYQSLPSQTPTVSDGSWSTPLPVSRSNVQVVKADPVTNPLGIRPSGSSHSIIKPVITHSGPTKKLVLGKGWSAKRTSGGVGSVPLAKTSVPQPPPPAGPQPVASGSHTPTPSADRVVPAQVGVRKRRLSSLVGVEARASDAEPSVRRESLPPMLNLGTAPPPYTTPQPANALTTTVRVAPIPSRSSTAANNDSNQLPLQRSLGTSQPGAAKLTEASPLPQTTGNMALFHPLPSKPTAPASTSTSVSSSRSPVILRREFTPTGSKTTLDNGTGSHCQSTHNGGRSDQEQMGQTNGTLPSRKRLRLSCSYPTTEPRAIKTIRGPRVPSAHRMAFSRDGTHFVLSCSDNTVRIWGTHTRTEVAVLDHHAPIVDTLWLENDAGVITLTDDGKVHKWAKTVQLEWNYSEVLDVGGDHRSTIDPLCFSYAPGRIAVSFPRLGVRVWVWNPELALWQRQGVILRQNVTAIKFVEDGNALIGGTRDGALWRCEVPHGTLRACAFLKHRITSLELNAQETHVLVGHDRDGHSSAVLVSLRQSLDTAQGSVLHSYFKEDIQPGAQIFCPAFATDTEAVLLGAEQGYVYVWDRKKARIVYALEHDQDDRILSVAALDGKDGCMLTATGSGHLYWWDLPVAAAQTADQRRKRVKC